MARRPYWQFVPVGFALPVIVGSQINWLDVHPWHGIIKLAMLFAASVPLLNATSRRLNDAGFDGAQAFFPFAPFAVLWVGYQCIYWGGAIIGAMGGFWIVAILVLALLVLIPRHLFALFASTMMTSTVIGQCLVASQPGTNTHGPNPHEVFQ